MVLSWLRLCGIGGRAGGWFLCAGGCYLRGCFRLGMEWSRRWQGGGGRKARRNGVLLQFRNFLQLNKKRVLDDVIITPISANYFLLNLIRMNMFSLSKYSNQSICMQADKRGKKSINWVLRRLICYSSLFLFSLSFSNKVQVKKYNLKNILSYIWFRKSYSSSLANTILGFTTGNTFVWNRNRRNG